MEQRLYSSIIHRLNEEEEYSYDDRACAGDVCRICMQGALANNLITPCRCAGSIRYVHEECLKAWVLSQGRIGENACELCQTVYDMEYKLGKVCTPKAVIQIREPMSLAFYFLCGVMSLVTYMTYTMWQYLLSPSTTAQQAKYIYGLLGLCVFMFIVFLTVLSFVVVRICVRHRLKSWSINSIVSTDNHSQMVQTPSFLDKIIIPDEVQVDGVVVNSPTVRCPNLSFEQQDNPSIQTNRTDSPSKLDQ